SDYVKTIHRKLSTISGKLLAAECADLSARARGWLGEEAPAGDRGSLGRPAWPRAVPQPPRPPIRARGRGGRRGADRPSRDDHRRHAEARAQAGADGNRSCDPGGETPDPLR